MQEFTRSDITAIELLTAEEYEKSRSLVPLCKTWWWLRSPGAYNNNAAYVFADGDVYPDGYFVYKEAGVRPAFSVRAAMTPGEKVKIGLCDATVTADGKCLLDACAAKHIFDESSNGWGGSALKAYLESEEFLALVFGEKENG